MHQFLFQFSDSFIHSFASKHDPLSRLLSLTAFDNRRYSCLLESYGSSPQKQWKEEKGQATGLATVASRPTPRMPL